MKLTNEFAKNLKIMFRNWTSLSLLVLAPLVFILLVGYAFSSEEVTGIKIGIISGQDISMLAENVSDYGTAIKYLHVGECLGDMRLEKIHICLELKGSVTGVTPAGEMPSGTVVYYYDNTRKAISLAVIQKIQDFFGMKAEQISIESAQTIIESIQNLIGFINGRKSDITQIKNESEIIKSDLTERKQKLEEVRADFMPSYLRMKELQKSLHNYSSGLNSSAEEFSAEVSRTIAEMRHLREGMELFEDAAAMAENAANTSQSNFSFSRLFADFESMELLLSGMSNLTLSTASELNSAVAEVDGIVEIADEIKFMLDEEIANTGEYIKKIDASIERIDEVSRQLDEKLSELSALHPEMAEQLVRPIASEYDQLLKGVGNIQVTFPQLLVIIIMFISLLFANIATITEINDRAYLRNLIAPVDNIIYFVGLFLTSAVIVFSQIVVLFIVAETKLGVNISGMAGQISLVSIMLISLFILVGMAFAYLFASVQSSILITTFFALLVFLFGNMLSPLEAMPSFARILTAFNPLVIGEYLIRQVQLFGTPLGLLTHRIALLVIYIGAMLLVVIALFKRRNMKRV